MSSLLIAFKEHLLFRKLCIVYILIYMWAFTTPTIDLAIALADNGYSGTDNALVIGAVFGLPLGIIGYLFKLYSTARKT